MHEYRLQIPKDGHGQSLRLFKANHEINIGKAIDQLSGICAGILADGNINDTEALFFRDWVQKYAGLEPVWPFTDILQRVERIFADGICDDNEREELKSVMQSICGHQNDSNPGETYSTTIPFCTPAPEPIVFEGKTFVITGRFAFGNRRKVVEAITLRGGIATDSTPSRDSNYLVIGLFASRDWIATNHGRKIERAVQLRESGSGIAIVSEEHWRRFAA